MKAHHFLLGLILLAAVPATIRAEGEVTRVVAMVNDKVFTNLDVQEVAAPQIERLKATYQGKELEENLRKLFDMTLDMMINRELIYLEFKSLKAQLPAAYVQMRIDSIIMSETGGDELKFEENLYQQGKTMKEFQDKIKRDIAIDMLLRSRVKNGVSIPDTAIEAYYDEHKFEMIIPTKYHIAVLMIRENGKYKDTLNTVMTELNQKLSQPDCDFTALVKSYSEGANAENGGDQGWLNAPHESIKEAIKEFKTGDVTKVPVKIGDNYYFIKLMDVQGGGIPPLDSALKETIKTKLSHDEENKRYQEFIRDLKMKYPVKMFR